MDSQTAAERLPALRQSTREELCERLMRARSFIDANYTRDLPLAEVAQVALLSKNHFLRSFKLAFGVTPHQYIVTRRLDHARNALIEGNKTVSNICRDVGFESLGSFSWVFKRHYGLSPEQYRKKIVSSTVQ